MASSFTIQAKGFDKLAKVLKDLPKRVQQEVRNEFVATGRDWEREAKTDAPTNVGRLRTSIISRSEGLTVEIAAQTNYAAYMEFGTKGKAKVPSRVATYAGQFRGKGPGGSNPIDALERWLIAKNAQVRPNKWGGRSVRRKPRSKATRQAAFAIFRYIKKHGVKPHPFLFSSKNNPGSADRLIKFENQLKTNVANALQQALNG